MNSSWRSFAKMEGGGWRGEEGGLAVLGLWPGKERGQAGSPVAWHQKASRTWRPLCGKAGSEIFLLIFLLRAYSGLMFLYNKTK